MKKPKYEKSGLYTNKELCEEAAVYWQNQGYNVIVKPVLNGWVHLRLPKKMVVK